MCPKKYWVTGKKTYNAADSDRRIRAVCDSWVRIAPAIWRLGAPDSAESTQCAINRSTYSVHLGAQLVSRFSRLQRWHGGSASRRTGRWHLCCDGLLLHRLGEARALRLGNGRRRRCDLMRTANNGLLAMVTNAAVLTCSYERYAQGLVQAQRRVQETGARDRHRHKAMCRDRYRDRY